MAVEILADVCAQPSNIDIFIILSFGEIPVASAAPYIVA
jgi:hypothetical protein